MSSLIDTDSNKQAARVLISVRTFLGEQNRNWVKPITQGDLAEMLAPHLGYRPVQTMVSKWERGNSLVPANVLFAAAKLVSKRLGRPVTVDELFAAEIKVS